MGGHDPSPGRDPSRHDGQSALQKPRGYAFMGSRLGWLPVRSIRRGPEAIPTKASERTHLWCDWEAPEISLRLISTITIRVGITPRRFQWASNWITESPNIYGVRWNVAPHPVYWAGGNGYSYQTASAPAFEQLPINWSAGFHDLVLSWETDNLLYEFVDGQLVAASYMEYPASTYVDALAGGETKLLAMNLLIGNQAIPGFTPGGTSAAENDGIADGWTMVVQEISVWNGNIVSPNSHQVAPNGCDAGCQSP